MRIQGAQNVNGEVFCAVLNVTPSTHELLLVPYVAGLYRLYVS